ncbi:hypothetical protein KP509_19G048100 [Ceratopteris richardii]|uniref:NADH dehydrogenase subunit 4 n=1 Tax=Ceratopteris richardii TaxID=49495 RepID=A0A8T2SLW7_CERRI|nr:hypothetical protein KP509_19G048100 [Ceratopteris richardii]
MLLYHLLMLPILTMLVYLEESHIPPCG